MPAIPQQYDKYRWKASESAPPVYRKNGAGVERIVDNNHRYHRGQDYMALGVDLSFADAVPMSDLLRAARDAWVTLRFTVPTIACTTEVNSDDEPLLVYHAAPDRSTVEAWAERTVASTEATTLADARIEIDRRRPTIPDAHGDQTFIYIVPRGSTKEYAVVLYGSHVPFDGVGYQAIMSHYLALVARYLVDAELASRDHFNLQWGKEGENLAVPYFEVVGEAEPLEGPVFESSVSTLMQDMGAMGRNHPYKSREAPGGPDAPRRIEHIFSEEDTAKILKHAKQKGFTINHLVQAAIALTTLVDNPSTAENAVLANIGLYNARERLRAPYNERLQYTGTATVASLTAVPVSVAQDIDDTRMRLDAVATALKPEYVRQRAFPALLGSAVTMVERVIPFLKMSPAQPGRCAPRFAADGIGERNLDPDYTDALGAHVFGIIDFFLCPRVTDNDVWFRAHTWRGRLKLSCDYNAAMLPREAPHGFLRMVMEMLTEAAR